MDRILEGRSILGQAAKFIEGSEMALGSTINLTETTSGFFATMVKRRPRRNGRH